jgi:hypothetical protein
MYNRPPQPSVSSATFDFVWRGSGWKRREKNLVCTSSDCQYSGKSLAIASLFPVVFVAICNLQFLLSKRHRSQQERNPEIISISLPSSDLNEAKPLRRHRPQGLLRHGMEASGPIRNYNTRIMHGRDMTTAMCTSVLRRRQPGQGQHRPALSTAGQSRVRDVWMAAVAGWIIVLYRCAMFYIVFWLQICLVQFLVHAIDVFLFRHLNREPWCTNCLH